MSLIPDPFEAKVKIPVRVVNGIVRYFYGDKIPLKPEFIGELIVPRWAIANKSFLRRMEQSHVVEILPVGSFVWMAVKHRYIPRAWWDRTVTLDGFMELSDARFVQVGLKENLRLEMRGTKKPMLLHCECHVPLLNQNAKSLNHAYSLISQTIEPTRASHNGNVFRLGFVRQGERWVSLNTLRDAAEAEFELNLSELDDDSSDAQTIKLSL